MRKRICVFFLLHLIYIRSIDQRYAFAANFGMEQYRAIALKLQSPVIMAVRHLQDEPTGWLESQRRRALPLLLRGTGGAFLIRMMVVWRPWYGCGVQRTSFRARPTTQHPLKGKPCRGRYTERKVVCLGIGSVVPRRCSPPWLKAVSNHLY